MIVSSHHQSELSLDVNSRVDWTPYLALSMPLKADLSSVLGRFYQNVALRLELFQLKQKKNELLPLRSNE